MRNDVEVFRHEVMMDVMDFRFFCNREVSEKVTEKGEGLLWQPL